MGGEGWGGRPVRWYPCVRHCNGSLCRHGGFRATPPHHVGPPALPSSRRTEDAGWGLPRDSGDSACAGFSQEASLAHPHLQGLLEPPDSGPVSSLCCPFWGCITDPRAGVKPPVWLGGPSTPLAGWVCKKILLNEGRRATHGFPAGASVLLCTA